MGGTSGIEDGFAASQPANLRAPRQRSALRYGGTVFWIVALGGGLLSARFLPSVLMSFGGVIGLFCIALVSGVVVGRLVVRADRRRAGKEAAAARKDRAEQQQREIIRAKVLGKFDRFGP